MRALLAAAAASVVLLPALAHAQQNPPPPPVIEGQATVQVGVAAPQQEAVAAPQPPPVPATPPVGIQPIEGGMPAPVQVTGPVSLACPLTPCQLPLVPGTYNLTVQGSGGFTRAFSLPGVPAVIGYRQRHTGRLVGGIIQLAIGGPFALTGIVLSVYSLPFYAAGFAVTGTIVLAVGIVALAVGVPLTIVGAINIARSGPQVDVRPGMMVGGRRSGRYRAMLTPVSGLTTDGYTGNVLSTLGVAF